MDDISTTDTLVRALISAKEAFTANVLIDMFEHSDLPEPVKWGIGDTFAYAKIDGMYNWITDQLKKEYKKEKEMLTYGLINKKPDDVPLNEPLELLKTLITLYPMQIIDIFGKHGNKKEADFLLEKKPMLDKKCHKQIDKAVDRIGKKAMLNY